ncbi:MAG TPA: immunoglobulin domain-containing protein, partial [Verrucomicrobiae bacterium]|nr:immunoglobulin domain-containing protein [Verrucomicrobiae bacterium]
SNSCSQTVTVMDHSGPLVVTQPQDQAVLLGRTATLSVEISSCPPVGYQWYFNATTMLMGETNSSLVLTNINSSQAGTYDAVVTNTYGSVTSSVANVTIQVPALIVGNPVDQIATNGDDVHWRVLAKGSAPLFYQWYFNLTNVLAEQTNSTLDLTNVSPADAGVYQVIVTNIFGSATSAPAVLTIVSPPILLSGPSDLVVTNGDTVQWTTMAQGTAPLTYRWFFNSTILGLETNATLVMSNVVPAQAGVYQVVVANDYGSVTSAPANLQIVFVPQITCSPNVTVPLGSPWDFTPPSFADTNLLVQVLDTTTNSVCGNSFSATRRWLISDTNSFQATCSQTVMVLDPAAPSMSCPTDKTVLAGTSWSFDLPSARESGATEALVYDNLTNALGQSFDPGAVEVGNQIALGGINRYPSHFTIEYWGTNATQSTFSGSVTARVRFYLNDGQTSSVSLELPGTLFYDSGPMPINAADRGTIDLKEFQLSAAKPLAGALPASFTWTVQFQGLGTGDAAGLNLYGPPVLGDAAAGYWAFQTNGWVAQGAVGQGFGSQLAALSSGVNLSVLNTTTNSQCLETYTVTRSWQALDSCSNAAVCSQTVTVVNPVPPLITSQPHDQQTGLGQTVQLAVGVSSCPPIGYQWYFNGATAVAGATNATLTLTNITIDLAGMYQAVITNLYGSVTSAPALVSVSGAPIIQRQPLDALVAQGGTAVFTVSAEGSPEPAYQWLFDDTNVLTGETSATLTLTNIQPVQAGYYSVVVSNSAGKVTSARANLAIIGAPTITAQPQGITNIQGQPVTFSVAAAGNAPLSYQWMAGCSRPISGATSSSLKLKSVGPLDSGTYCVTVSNALGVVSSQPAVLRVLVQPKLVALTENHTGASLSFSTVANLFYSVYFSDTLPATNWTLLPNMFRQLGTGAPMAVQDAAAHGAARFYQIRVE